MIKKILFIICILVFLGFTLYIVYIYNRRNNRVENIEDFTINYSYVKAGKDLDSVTRYVNVYSNGKVIINISNTRYDIEPVTYKIDPVRAKQYIVNLLNGWFMYLPDDLSNKECTGADSTNLGFTSNIGSKNIYEYCSGNKTYAKAVDDFMSLIGESRLKNFNKELEKKYGDK